MQFGPEEDENAEAEAEREREKEREDEAIRSEEGSDKDEYPPTNLPDPD